MALAWPRSQAVQIAGRVSDYHRLWHTDGGGKNDEPRFRKLSMGQLVKTIRDTQSEWGQQPVTLVWWCSLGITVRSTVPLFHRLNCAAWSNFIRVKPRLKRDGALCWKLNARDYAGRHLSLVEIYRSKLWNCSDPCLRWVDFCECLGEKLRWRPGLKQRLLSRRPQI